MSDKDNQPDQPDAPEGGHTCPGCGQVHDGPPIYNPLVLDHMSQLAGWLGHSSKPHWDPERGPSVLVPITHPVFQMIANTALLAKRGEPIVDAAGLTDEQVEELLARDEDVPEKPCDRPDNEAAELLEEAIDMARGLVEEGRGYIALITARPEQGGNA